VGHDVEIARCLAAALTLQQQAHFHRGQRRMLERPREIDVIRAGRPREVVDVLAVERVGAGAVRVAGPGSLAAGRAEHERLRHGHAHVVDAEVREELGGGVELMRVPAGFLQHAQFRKPLGDEVVVVDIARARKRPWHLRAPLDLDLDRVAGPDRLWQRHREHGAVLCVAVVWRDEPDPCRQIGRNPGPRCAAATCVDRGRAGRRCVALRGRAPGTHCRPCPGGGRTGQRDSPLTVGAGAPGLAARTLRCAGRRPDAECAHVDAAPGVRSRLA
jgi:hypothetical protein